MPCLFKTEVKPSPIHGLGLFAMEDIPRGAVYWAWHSPDGFLPVLNIEVGSNQVYTESELHAIEDEETLKGVLHGGFYIEGADVFVELKDGSQFTNHAEDCNSQVVFDPSGDYRRMTYIAKKDIRAGEEITDNYGNYLSTNAEWVDVLMRTHLPDRKEIEAQVIAAQNAPPTAV